MTDPGMSEDRRATLASVAGVEDLDTAGDCCGSARDLERAVNVAIGVAPSPDRASAAGASTRRPPTARGPPRPPGSSARSDPRAPSHHRPREPRHRLRRHRPRHSRLRRRPGAVLPPLSPAAHVRSPTPSEARWTTQSPPRRDRPTYAAACGDAQPRFQRVLHRAALREAQDQLKFLFVYLHSPDHPDAPRFCRDVLCDPRVRSLVDERFVAWGGDVRRSDAFRLAAAVSPSTFPYVALLSNVDGRASLVLAVEGTVGPNLVELLTRAAEEHGTAFDRRGRERSGTRRGRCERNGTRRFASRSRRTRGARKR